MLAVLCADLCLETLIKLWSALWQLHLLIVLLLSS